MRFQRTFAFSTAMVAGAFVGACAIPQPTFECNALAPFWASYEIQSGAGTGTCSELPGDLINMQRYLLPGSMEPTIGIMPRRLGRLRLTTNLDGTYAYVDPTDPQYAKEAAIGTFSSLLPDKVGVCTMSSIAPTDQNYPAGVITVEGEDGGVAEEPLDALAIKYEWSNMKILSTAQYPGTLFVADLHLKENDCDATFKVYGIHPLVPCDSDIDCDPSPDTDGGPRTIGSGMSADYAPRCKLYPDGTPESMKGIRDYAGICFPTKGFDELAK